MGIGIENRLREMFARRVGQVNRSEDAWHSISHRMERRQRRAAMSRLLGAAAVLVLFAGVISLLWTAFQTRDGSSPPADPTASLDLNIVVGESIRVGRFPRGVAAGEGNVWVAIPERDLSSSCSGAVVRVDAETNQAVETIPVNGTPSAVAVGGNSIWIASRLCAPDDDQPGVVLRIDTETNHVVATIPVGDSPAVPIDIATDGTGVWATLDLDGGMNGQVVHIDGSTNEVVGRVDVEGRLRDIVVGEGATWVLNTDQLNPSVIRINPGEDQIAASIPLRGSPEGLVAGADAVWTSSGRIDPRTNEVEEIPLGSTFDPFAAGVGGVWFRGLNVDSHTISRLDPQTLKVDESVSLDAFPVDAALDLETSTVWVADEEDSIISIDLEQATET
jgi:DNA-binding beta-propeller fold protein YncE